MQRTPYVANAAIVLALATAALQAAPGAAVAQCLTSECDIAGNCIGANTLNPANSCEECRPQTNKNAWTPLGDGEPCDDGLYCTVADTCSSGQCGGLPRACTDFAACTVDSCDEAADTCHYAIQPGQCFIGGLCMTTGTLSPGDPCWICDPSRGATVYAPNEGASCDDGRYCTLDDTCDAWGQCVVVTQRSCDDRLACTSDVCDEVDDACAHGVALDHCVVDGHCRDDGEPNPDQDCEVCDSEASDSSWSPAAEGTACGVAECSAGMLTAPALCDADGDCTASPAEPCPSGRCLDASRCLGPCVADAECPAAAFCRQGACLNDQPLGESCDHPGQCLSDHCADGVCCERACDDLCEACDAAGSCEAHERGTDPDDECAGDGACDGARACQPAAMSADAGRPPRDVDSGAAAEPEPQPAGGDAEVDGGPQRGGESGRGDGCSISAGRDGGGLAWSVLMALASALAARRRRLDAACRRRAAEHGGGLRRKPPKSRLALLRHGPDDGRPLSSCAAGVGEWHRKDEKTGRSRMGQRR